ncbi:SDR family NAD(P)-dependent oxidoreductase [Nocardia sp. NPDC088792]|uniref:SDR family NAD(P)-dependent oxidoreductase n=1 Tax=Nocardia sp. NPDC088792 TaxID=3364332 RepID=UPI0038219F86
MSDQTFAERHILITGGGTGIGRATALAFADQGAARVTIVGRRNEPLAEVAAIHPAVVPLTADATTSEGIEAIDASVTEHGGLDVLVHNAGIYRTTPLDELNVDAVRDQLEINLIAPLLLTARLLPVLTAPGASIVLVSSISARFASPTTSVYAATKAATDSFIRSWAMELGPKGIRVNGVAPGLIDTDIHAAGGLDQKLITAWHETYAAAVPTERVGRVEDVTPWITRLAEPASAWVTGEIIAMDGGGLLL